MEIERINREFKSRRPLYKQLEKEALFILNKALNQTDIRLHSTTSRVKQRKSFIDKVKRKNVSEPFGEIQDIVGVRVVCLFLSDIQKIGDVIRDSFSVLSKDNKIEGADVSSFGYMSLHFIVTMKEEYVGPRYDTIAKLPFEIQVRTIAMDAWANVSHHLDYKTDKDVPPDLKRDFYALSGLFYVADKHFEIFYGSSKESQEKMVEFFVTATLQAKAEQEINYDTLTAYLQTRFPDRVRSEPQVISSLIDILLDAGYKTIGDVDRLVNIAYETFLQYETDHPADEPDGRFFDAGVIRMITELVDEKRVYLNWDFDNLGLVDEDKKQTILTKRNQKFAPYREKLKE